MNFNSHSHRCRHLLPIMEDIAFHGRLSFGRGPDGEVQIQRQSGGPYESAMAAAITRGVTACAAMVVESHVQALGPKVFRPTAEQVEALARTEPRVPFAEYRQPFPALVVEYPEGGFQGAEWTAILHTPACVVCLTALADREQMVLTLSPRNDEDTLSDLLAQAGGYLHSDSLLVEEGESAASLTCARVAINACLLLTLYGCQRKGTDNPSHEARLQRNLDKARRGKGKDVAQAERELRTLPVVYEFARQVDLTRRGDTTEAESTGSTGRHVHPHWRCGHLRSQRVGVGLTETKLVYIAPVLVNSHLLLGKPANTLTVYRVQ